MDWLDSQPPGRRRLYSLFLALVLLTLPCYAAGLFLLAFGTPPPPDNPAPVMTALPTATVLTPTAEPTFGRIPTSPPASAPNFATDEPEPVATPIFATLLPGTVLAETATPVALPTLTEVPTIPAVTETATEAPTVETPPPPATEPATPEPPTTEPPTEPPTPSTP
jgi:hypothetical protein